MAVAQTSLECGKPATGAVTAARQFVSHTLTAEAGDTITVKAFKTSGDLSPRIELYDPNQTQLINVSQGSMDRSVNAAGTYTVKIGDNSRTGTGEYVVIFQRPNRPCNARTIACGQSVRGSLARPGQFDFYTFEAPANEIVIPRIARTAGEGQPVFELYGRSGRLNGPTQTPVERFINQTGTYMLFVSLQQDYRAADYSVVWQRLNSPCNTKELACGVQITSRLTAPGEWQFFTLQSSGPIVIRAGTMLRSLFPRWELYNPMFNPETNGWKVDWSDSGRLDSNPNSSRPSVLVLGDGDGAGVGEYSLIWQSRSNPCGAKPLPCGKSLAGSIQQPGGIVTYSLDARTDDEIAARVRNWTGLASPLLELYWSGHTIATGFGSVSSTLLGNGQRDSYYLFVSSVLKDLIGSFDVSYNRSNRPCSIEDGEPPTVTVNAPSGDEVLAAGSKFTVRWTARDNLGIASHEVRLSTDGGTTYGNVVASGLAGGAASYEWSIPDSLETTSARILVIATDQAGNTGRGASVRDFAIVSSDAGESRTTTYEYDALNRLRRVLHPDGSVTSYEYDALGNVVRRITQK